ncbi:hypothetical protein O6P43_020913 [Quillaja saponaria]|uniref:Uncharacterized protein n=1 Tax=Quillaja saponaria TaxID=32244 RepID=A0AAD7PLY5_QUISA|nr:hypothetical protein O6P43_020913 [Quillaja saponaria]
MGKVSTVGEAPTPVANEGHLEELVLDVKAMLLKTAKYPFPISNAECFMYQVPPNIREINEEAYTPKVISIGPFHFGNQRCQYMESYKLSFFKSFLERVTNQIDLKSLISYIKELEPRVRGCYANIIELNRDQFVKVILVDACFILELFWRCHFDGDCWTDENAFFLQPWLSTTMKLDLLLLENQLPFFVLENIFQRAFASLQNNDEFPSLLQLTFGYFACYNLCNHVGLDHLATRGIEIKHFTDLVRSFHLPPLDKLPFRGDGLRDIHLHTATELAGAGLKFKASSSRCLFNLQFSTGNLEIPQFRVDRHNESLFRNLMALEQRHYPFQAFITDYICIMCFLVNTGQDIDILVKSGVIVNGLGGSDAAANLFNNFLENIITLNYNDSYVRLYDDLNAFYEDPFNKSMAALKRDYCSTHWKKIASVAAVALLLLAIVQTIFTVKSAV